MTSVKKKDETRTRERERERERERISRGGKATSPENVDKRERAS